MKKQHYYYFPLTCEKAIEGSIWNRNIVCVMYEESHRNQTTILGEISFNGFNESMNYDEFKT